MIACDYNINYYGRHLRPQPQDDNEEDLTGPQLSDYRLYPEADYASVKPGCRNQRGFRGSKRRLINGECSCYPRLWKQCGSGNEAYCQDSREEGVVQEWDRLWASTHIRQRYTDSKVAPEWRKRNYWEIWSAYHSQSITDYFHAFQAEKAAENLESGTVASRTLGAAS